MKSTTSRISRLGSGLGLLMAALLAVAVGGATQVQAKQTGTNMMTCGCSSGNSCSIEGCSHHGQDHRAYRQLLGATQAVVISSDALTKISADLDPRYKRTHVPAQRVHNSSLRLIGTLMSQHDNCGRWKRLVDLVNHKMRDLARGYELDHARWKNPQVGHAYDTMSKDHSVFVSTFNGYFEAHECVPNSVGDERGGEQ